MSSAEGPVTQTRMLAALTNMAGKSQPHRIPNMRTVYHACVGWLDVKYYEASAFL